MRGLLRKKVTWVVLTIAVVAAAVGLWAFEPWRLLTRSEVDEALPAEFAAVEVTTTTAPPTTSEAAMTTTAPVTTAPVTTTAKPGPTVLAEGAFVSQEHATRGTAKVLESGGKRILRLEGFSTSDGPDLHIWLSDATAGGEWGKYDDGRYVRLGEMKATDGNQNYAIPADVDLSGLRSVVVWCDRFNVAFGSAPLDL
ncbi:DM13 domain-containing protein [Actinokineospora soli]|uniref:DM13 domain-containing protein n=1 Tax=Actinokineospora soli TaxID=1048753 RepID=A0ABW2U008_9PSEU